MTRAGLPRPPQPPPTQPDEPESKSFSTPSAAVLSALCASKSRCSHADSVRPRIKLPQGQITLHAMPLFPLTNLFFQRRQQVKCYVGRLKVFRVGMSDV